MSYFKRNITNCPIYILAFLINLLAVFQVSADPQKIYFCSDGTLANPITDFAKLKVSNFDGSNIQTVRTGKVDFMRGCQYDSGTDKLFLWDYDTSDSNFKIYRVSPDNSSQTILQFPRIGDSLYGIFGSFAVDGINSLLYWPDTTNWNIKYASSVNPLVDGPNPQNVPEILSTSPSAGVFQPVDLEIDTIEGVLYVANSNGGITRIELDGSGSEYVVEGGPGVAGIAVDPVNRRIFYTLSNNQVWRAELSGANPTELTSAIGDVSDFTHRRADIDYDIDTNKIYWLEYADPNPGFGLNPPPGKLRRANPDGSGAEDVISDIGYRALFLSFKYGTLKPALLEPVAGRTYITEMPIVYNLGEPPKSGSVKVRLKQGNDIIASMTLGSHLAITTTVNPFSSNLNSSFVSESSGFPIAQGKYSVELTYEDLAGNPAASTVVGNVTLVLPTPTNTATPTITSTSTPSATHTPTVTPAITSTVAVPSSSNTPQISPTEVPDTGCVSTAELPTLSLKGTKASLKISAKAGVKYKFFAKPAGSPAQKGLSKSIKALKNGKLKVSFTKLQPGLWEFSYSVKIKKITTQSCSVQTLVK